MCTLKRFTLLISLLLFVNLANAKQVNFSKIEKGDSYQFSYQWLDHQDQLQSMTFLLDKRALFDRFRNFRVYKPEIAQQYINKDIVNYLNKSPIKKVKVTYDEQSGNLAIKTNTEVLLNKAQKKVIDLNQKFTERYLKSQQYHTFVTHGQNLAIKPDHASFATLSADDLKPIKPLILEKVSIQNIRKATNYVLGFVQSIPYSTLESRINSSGAGFNPPLKLLWENQGDCDSKVTLTAAILRSLMPRIKMVLVYIDNHALLGIDALANGNEKTINLDGTTYLLAEPTGPSLLPLGIIADASHLAIDQGQYSAEKFH